jgi:hypothetical protein
MFEIEDFDNAVYQVARDAQEFMWAYHSAMYVMWDYVEEGKFVDAMYYHFLALAVLDQCDEYRATAPQVDKAFWGLLRGEIV